MALGEGRFGHKKRGQISSGLAESTSNELGLGYSIVVNTRLDILVTIDIQMTL